MGCFSCFSSNEKKAARMRSNSSRRAQQPVYSPPHQKVHNTAPQQPQQQAENCKPRPPPESTNNKDIATDHNEAANGGNNVIAAQTFSFRELATATKNFRQECLIGEGGFGRVYKGKLDKSGQVVAVKQLDRNGLQGNREFLVEYMPMGSLEDHLLDLALEQKPLDWFSRMKIALGAAKEYQRTGQLTVKSDVYSFGVVLLELISGKRAIDTTRQIDEQHLVAWAQPIFKEPNRFPELADPLLHGDFPIRSLNQAVAVSAMCLNEEASVRPLMSDVVSALSFLRDGVEAGPEPVFSPSPPTMEDSDSIAKERQLAVAEAIEWGSNSRNIASRCPSASSL
ncbi:unnamed protein product [Dovyalis caffra]|uniref:Protein kinase domain-containing protein n=1 Tax=Dovyalis caffra TaxID=77055 RepID=A0AAV1SEX5_9ROSI|nr:unnamed protein product [Dovyalis caffra]